MIIHWAPTALRDLEVAADRMAGKIIGAINALTRSPEMGTKGRVTGTRELVISPLVIVYRLSGDAIELAAIIHGSRKWPGSF